MIAAGMLCAISSQRMSTAKLDVYRPRFLGHRIESYYIDSVEPASCSRFPRASHMLWSDANRSMTTGQRHLP
jgi:hypothetical protein